MDANISLGTTFHGCTNQSGNNFPWMQIFRCHNRTETDVYIMKTTDFSEVVKFEDIN